MKKVLNTVTEVTRAGSQVDIFTYYTDEDFIKFLITETVGKVEDVEFLENELIYRKNGYEDVSFKVNEKGELIVIANNADGFEIDEDSGELYLTENGS